MKLNMICTKFHQTFLKQTKFWTFEAIFQPWLQRCRTLRYEMLEDAL